MKKRISVASAKAKGRELQKWTAQKISDITGIKCGKDELIESREMGQSGADIKLIGIAQKVFPFSVEAKRCEKIKLSKFIEQAKSNQKEGTDWLLITRRSNEKAVISIDAEVFFKLYEKIIDSFGFDLVIKNEGKIFKNNSYRKEL